MALAMAVIGYGWAGKIHARVIKNNLETRLIAVVDKNINKINNDYLDSELKFFNTVDELLDSDTDFEGACICTPTFTHYELARKLLLAGKNVFCEKPLVETIDQAKELIKIKNKKNLKFGVNYNQRFASPIKKVGKMITDNEQIHMLKINMFQKGPVNKSELVGRNFLITDACCHLIDTALYINGGIKEVFSFTNSLNSEIISDITVNLRFNNGSIGMMTNTFVGGEYDSQHPFHRLEVITDEARYVVNNMYDSLKVYPNKEFEYYGWQPSVFNKRDYQYSMKISLDKWIDCTDNNKTSPVSLEDGYKNLKIVKAILNSYKTQKPVTV